VSDTIPKSMQDADPNEFPSNVSNSDVSVRLCMETDCDTPCVKRGRGYAKFCGEHLFNHTVDDTKPNTRTVTTTKDKVAKKAENQAKALLAFAQGSFIAQGDQYCAWAVGECAEPIAENLGAVASDIKFVANMVEKGDKYFALVMLTANITKLGLMIGVHHDLVPYTGPIKLIVPKPPAKTTDDNSVAVRT
jgi:hypothetical protein